MPSLFDTAKIQDNRPGPVDVGNGKTYCGPVWKDADGFFVLFANARVDVAFDRSDRQWKRDGEADDMECQGHPAGLFDPMGETVYCDGSCRH